MKLTLALILIYFLLVLFAFTSSYTSTHYEYTEPLATSTIAVKVPKMPQVERSDPTPYQAQLILQKAAEYGVDPVVMIDVISCESDFNPTALGDGGKSRGLVQIHSSFHPEVTDSMAYDQEFAIDFLAKYLSEGKGSQWSCYRKLLASR